MNGKTYNYWLSPPEKAISSEMIIDLPKFV
jgi:hypothetical protein